MNLANPSAPKPKARLAEFILASPVLWLLIKRDLKSRYAGSSLGAIWNLIHPIVLVGIYVLVFSNIMKDRAGGGSMLGYAVHLTAGMIPWFIFSDIVNRCTGALVENANFLQKVALPVEVLHLSIFVNTILIYSISAVALALFLIIVGHPVPVQVVLAFPLLILIAIMGLGFGLILSVLNLVMRDIAQIIQIGLQLLFWLTPIVYPISILPDQIQILLRYNPLLPFISYAQACYGATDHAMVEVARPEVILNTGIHVLAILPFLSIAAGIMFLRSHRSELLDAL